MVFITPSKTIMEEMKVCCKAFVDDCTLLISDEPGCSLQSLIAKTEHDANLWNQFLHSSGGKLELSKTSFYVIYFNFDQQGQPQLMHHTDLPIQLTDKDGNHFKIKSNNIYTPSKNLGHHKCPATNYKIQTKEIQKKATEISQAIMKCNINREDAQMLYRTVYRSAVEYCLGASFLNEQQCNQIERTTMTPIIRKCGFAKSTAKAILYAPLEIGGEDLPIYLTRQELTRSNTSSSTTEQNKAQFHL